MTDTRSLQGQVALITGASSGLGRAAAVEFAQAGADIVLIARSARDLQEVAGEVEALGRRALILPLDLEDEQAIERAAAEVTATFGRVDVLVNNAGTDVPGRVVELSAQDWDRVLGVNLRAPFLLSKAVFPLMQRQGRGVILNISSTAGKRGWANASAYCASKFALSGFTQALAAEGREHGIRAMVIFPGALDTHWGQWTPEARQEGERAAKSQREALPPQEVARLLVWVAASPAELVLNEVIATPLLEQGWP
ncbi:SDR family oxidoreductase [Deinococcus aestuarii]|uniref:SDR family oxidoreductase n=1 Tax=Deinococcus aestuarii TaxID=2774531 RepID=UPI001C0B4C1E|nr:SDR family oxidoreductase [Deinococcus aestuarii]